MLYQRQDLLIFKRDIQKLSQIDNLNFLISIQLLIDINTIIQDQTIAKVVNDSFVSTPRLTNKVLISSQLTHSFQYLLLDQ